MILNEATANNFELMTALMLQKLNGENESRSLTVLIRCILESDFDCDIEEDPLQKRKGISNYVIAPAQDEEDWFTVDVVEEAKKNNVFVNSKSSMLIATKPK